MSIQPRQPEPEGKHTLRRPMLLAIVFGNLLSSWPGAVRYSLKPLEKVLGTITLLASMALGHKLLF